MTEINLRRYAGPAALEIVICSRRDNQAAEPVSADPPELPELSPYSADLRARALNRRLHAPQPSRSAARRGAFFVYYACQPSDVCASDLARRRDHRAGMWSTGPRAVEYGGPSVRGI